MLMSYILKYYYFNAITDQNFMNRLYFFFFYISKGQNFIEILNNKKENFSGFIFEENILSFKK